MIKICFFLLRPAWPAMWIRICNQLLLLVGGFKHFFHNIWDNPSHWLICFRGVGIPPTSFCNCSFFGIGYPQNDFPIFFRRKFKGYFGRYAPCLMGNTIILSPFNFQWCLWFVYFPFLLMILLLDEAYNVSIYPLFVVFSKFSGSHWIYHPPFPAQIHRGSTRRFTRRVFSSAQMRGRKRWTSASEGRRRLGFLSPFERPRKIPGFIHHGQWVWRDDGSKSNDSWTHGDQVGTRKWWESPNN